jgi:hypothetical protein
MAIEEHSSHGRSASRPVHLRRRVLGALGLIVLVAVLSESGGLDPAERSAPSLSPQVPAQIEDWRGNSAHLEPAAD